METRKKDRGKLILVTGGARSGKSSFAERYADSSGKRVVYIATATVEDDEMQARVRAHRERRPSSFVTVEEPFYPHLIFERERGENTFFLLDCLTLLLTNLILKEGDIGENNVIMQKKAEEVLDYTSKLSAQMRSIPSDVLVVTNEVGSGVVPTSSLGRFFRDLAGKANQLVAAGADEVWLLVSGIEMRIK
ncbi:MAG: bifunctional adenosylcobinamide kinase/adenosylcobinamide-phosphate guanylyltransferase [Dethiobacter sp.]|jgi:adenosylcobinamide kinase/adenosylcobinamide-phosphate guanylyltransferase|nr:MAG: bifunctional adenosylcobinamide kinase/adenosylcobinamide-phosphate guanylyltransferase [Dethiobacter sp.]